MGPATDKRFTIWEATQHLIRRLEHEGEESAAALLRKLGGTGRSPAIWRIGCTPSASGRNGPTKLWRTMAWSSPGRS
jgi:hypothetical protein